MFTGIVECTGRIVSIATKGSNHIFEIQSVISKELKVDQSLSHDGVCLTVTNVQGDHHFVTAVEETLNKSDLGKMTPGSLVNLERSMLNNGRFDGHIVQGHVDQVGIVKNIEEKDGSWLFTFEYKPSASALVVEKGSISINGVSLTCFDLKENQFSVAIIPYTFDNTTFKQLYIGSLVNLEFDILGKYIQRILKT
jgi:riboflavin synthase